MCAHGRGQRGDLLRLLWGVLGPRLAPRRPGPPAVPTGRVASAQLDRRPEDFAPSPQLLWAGSTEGQVRTPWLPVVDPRPRRSGGGPTPTRWPHLHGQPPHRVLRPLLLLSAADPEGPVGALFGGPVSDTFLGRRQLAVRGGGVHQLEQGQHSKKGAEVPACPTPPAGGSLRPTPAEEVLTAAPSRLESPVGCTSGPFWEEGAGPGCRCSQLPGEPEWKGCGCGA